MALLVPACSSVRSIDPTQTVVVVDAEALVRARSDGLRVTVRSADDGNDNFARTYSRRNETLAWPRVLPLEPKGGDASRRFEVEATATDGAGRLVATARAISGYVEHRQIVLDLVLEDACIEVECGDQETCRGGDCGSAIVDPADLPSFVGNESPAAGVLMPRADGGTPGQHGDGTDAGNDSGLTHIGDRVDSGGNATGDGGGAAGMTGDGGGQLECGVGCTEYEMCLGNGCRKCTLFADRFERPDNDSLGNADYPDVPWVQEMGDYDIVGGTLTKKVTPGIIGVTTTAVVVADLGSDHAGIHDRIRLRYRVRFDEASTFANAGFDHLDGSRTGLSVSLFQDGSVYMWETSNTVLAKNSSAFALNIDHFVEAIVDAGMMSVAVSTGDYASSGGVLEYTAMRTVGTAAVGSRIKAAMNDGGTNPPNMAEVILDRYPCLETD